jgi:asparagine synthetase B (glutamine-hydrolysing)
LCGIAGIRKYGEKPIEEYMIRLLLTGLEHRGNDATGIALQNKKGDVYTLKQDVPAWSFVTSHAYEEWIEEHLNADAESVILHARAATKGSPRIAKNNHPLFNGCAAIVHNGKIENDDAVFSKLKLDRAADTDTDIVRAIIDRFGITPKAIEMLNEIRGSAAIAALSPEHPGKMLVGRSGSPLSLGSTDDFLFFASEKNTIHRAMKPVKERFGIMFQQQSLEMAFGPYPDNTLWILGPDGKEFHGELKSFWGTYKDPIRRVYVDYKQRQDDWTKKATPGVSVRTSYPPVLPKQDGDKILLSCPKCQKPLVLGKHQLSMNLDDLVCPKDRGGCGAPLGEARVN